MTFEVEQKLDESSEQIVSAELKNFEKPQEDALTSEDVWLLMKKMWASYEKPTTIIFETTYTYTPETNKRAKAIFHKALEIIRNPDNWCQGFERRVVNLRKAKKAIGFNTPNGKKLPAYSFLNNDFANQAKRVAKQAKTVYEESARTFGDDSGVKYCSIGAIKEVAGFYRGYTNNRAPAEMVLNHLEQTMGMQVSEFNDKYSHAKVIQAWEQTGKDAGWM